MNEQLAVQPEINPTVELIHQLEDRLRQRAVDAGVTHEPVLGDLDAVEHVDDGGRLLATRQRFKVGAKDPSAPVEDVYSWLNVTITTSEEPQSLGVEKYEITESRRAGSPSKGAVRWSDGDTEITRHVVTPRGPRTNVLSDEQIGNLLDRVDNESAIVVDLARSKVVEAWKDGGNGLEYLVSQVVSIEEPK